MQVFSRSWYNASTAFHSKLFPPQHTPINYLMGYRWWTVIRYRFQEPQHTHTTSSTTSTPALTPKFDASFITWLNRYCLPPLSSGCHHIDMSLIPVNHSQRPQKIHRKTNIPPRNYTINMWSVIYLLPIIHWWWDKSHGLQANQRMKLNPPNDMGFSHVFSRPRIVFPDNTIKTLQHPIKVKA